MESCKASVLAYILDNHQRDMAHDLDVSWSSLGFESLALLDVVLSCERRYGIWITDEMIAEMETLHDLIGQVDRQRAA